MNNTNTILGITALLSFLGVGLLIVAAQSAPSFSAAHTSQQASVSALEASDAFRDVSLIGDAGYIFDLSTNKSIFQKNESAQLPLASLTKVAVVILAAEHLDMKQTIVFREQSLRPEGDSGFVVGEAWNIRDLIDFTLMTSSNDGAAALADALETKTGTSITELLNALARELQLAQTYFINETGLDSSRGLSGAYGSAHDVAMLFTYAYKTSPHLFSATAVAEHVFVNASGVPYKAVNTNKVVGKLPGLVFGKTGFTDLAGGNLAVVVETEPGHPLVIVILGSTLDGRFTDVVTLAHATLRTPQ